MGEIEDIMETKTRFIAPRKAKSRERISLEIPKTLRSRIEAQCVARSETISVFVRKAIAERIKRLEGGPCDM